MSELDDGVYDVEKAQLFNLSQSQVKMGFIFSGKASPKNLTKWTSKWKNGSLLTSSVTTTGLD